MTPRRRQPRTASQLTFVLDAGAIIAEARGQRLLRGLIHDALVKGEIVVVPAIVVAQTFRGDAADHTINRLLKSVYVPPVDLDLAKEAGRLLARTGMSDAADAVVIAEAIRRQPCVVLTSDPGDLERLAEGYDRIQIVHVDG